MGEPRIKGLFVQGVVEMIRRHLDAGRIDEAWLEARLEPEDLRLLDEKIPRASWQSIHAYRRLAELAIDLVDGPREEICHATGVADARRMIEAGLYQQLDSLPRLGRGDDGGAASFEAFGRQLKLVMSLSQAVYDFTRWEVGVDPDHPRRYQVTVSDAEFLPDVNVIGSVGFFDECSRVARPDRPITWRWSRPRRDLVVFRMNEDVPVS